MDLPLEVGDLKELCTDLSDEWRSAAYQRTRTLRLRQADALAAALATNPETRLTATVIDAQIGEGRMKQPSVLQLAQEQLGFASDDCNRPETADTGRRQAGRTNSNHEVAGIGPESADRIEVDSAGYA